MSNYNEILGIDLEDTLNLADVYSNYAKSFSADSSENELHIAASSYVIGAVYQSLIDPEKARNLFKKASFFYEKLDMPFWRVCDICSQIDSEIKYSFTDIDRNEFFYWLLHKFNDSVSPSFLISVDLLVFQENLPEFIPGIFVPYSGFLSALRDSFSWDNRENEYKVDSFIELIFRFGKILDKIRKNEDAWRNLQGNILPFEPTVLAIVIVLVKKWMKNNSFEELLEYFKEVKEEYKVLLYISNKIISSTHK